MVVPQLGQSEQEVCSNCGNFVDELNEQTGWCYICSPSAQPNQYNTVSRLEKWLAKYADTIEDEMQTSQITARQAITVVVSTHHATCVICNNVIKHGTFGRHFICSSTPQCKKARRRYKYLIYEKGYTKQAALIAIIPGEPNGY